MIPQGLIERKRDGGELSPDEFAAFLTGYLSGDIPDYQMSAFLMAVVFRGLSERELNVLLTTMVDSGSSLDLDDLSPHRVDKHSTGGVGDKVSLIVAPLVASLGALVPMMSGRALGHTGGTLDKLEAIPGFRTGPSLSEFRSILERVGCAMIGPTAEIAPLDRRLYALRDLTGTVPSPALMTASILSKKLAEGINALVLDVKVGRGAFISDLDRARSLAQTMVGIANHRGVRTVARLTAMDRPLGRAVGNGLEVREAIETLAGGGPEDLRLVSVELAAEMLVTSGASPALEAARARCIEALRSGQALDRFRLLVEAQGGDPIIVDDPEALPAAPQRLPVIATDAGRVQGIDPLALGWGVVELGGGRRRIEEGIDYRVGFTLEVEVGESVEVGQRLGTVHAASPQDAQRGVHILRTAVELGEYPVQRLPLLGERIVA